MLNAIIPTRLTTAASSKVTLFRLVPPSGRLRSSVYVGGSTRPIHVAESASTRSTVLTGFTLATLRTGSGPDQDYFCARLHERHLGASDGCAYFSPRTFSTLVRDIAGEVEPGAGWTSTWSRMASFTRYKEKPVVQVAAKGFSQSISTLLMRRRWAWRTVRAVAVCS